MGPFSFLYMPCESGLLIILYIWSGKYDSVSHGLCKRPNATLHPCTFFFFFFSFSLKHWSCMADCESVTYN